MRSEGSLPRLSQILPFEYLRKLLTNHILIGLPVGIFVIVVPVAVRYAWSPWRSAPPGPRGLPILGNAFQLQEFRTIHTSGCSDELPGCIWRVHFFCMAQRVATTFKIYYKGHNGLECFRLYTVGISQSRRAGTDKPSPLIVNLEVNLCPIY
jgi:hypothetical protein